LPKKHVTEKCHFSQASYTLNSRRNCSGVTLGALLYMSQGPRHTENLSGSIWRALKCGAGEDWRR
jgi:hypothetical protein